MEANTGKVDAKKMQRTMNPKTIKVLVSKNCDLSLIRGITHVFYSSDPLCKSTIERELIKRGFTIYEMKVTEPFDDVLEYCVDATIMHRLDHGRIDVVTDTCIDVASYCGAEYDGWHTEVD